MYFVIDSFSATSTSSDSNNVNVSVDIAADSAHLHRHFELPGNIVLPSWLPLDPRVKFLLVSIAAPFLISSIGLLGVGTKLGFWWFICFLTVLFLLVFGAALLSGHYAVESYEIIASSTRIVYLCVGLPLFLALLGVVLIHFWRARRRQYLQQQEFMHDVKNEIAQRQAATMKVASIVDREQLSLNALATQLARQRKRNWRIHHFRWLDVCLQGIFVLVCLIGVFVAWGIIPLHDSLELLQQTIVFRVIGALCLVVLILCLIWLVMYFSFTGRKLMHYVRNYMSQNIISIVMFGLSFLYTTMVVNFVTVLYCETMICGPSTIPHDTASVFPVTNYNSGSKNHYMNLNNNNNISFYNSATNYSMNGEEGNCIAINVHEYSQLCNLSWQHNISTRIMKTKRLVYDTDVACGKTTGLFRAGAALIFASYICLLPWYQYMIARYTVHILKDEYPLERRFNEAFSQEELYYQRISSSNNPGQEVFRAYKPQFRYYSFSFMLQKIVLAVVSCTTRNGMSENLQWIPYVCFALVPCVAAVASCYFKPFARPTERMYFPTIQGMVCLISLYGLIGYLCGISHIPLCVGIVLAIMAIVIPLLMLIWGTICSLYAEREENVKLRERLRVRFAQSLAERHVMHTNQKNVSNNNCSNRANNMNNLKEESESEQKQEMYLNAQIPQTTSGSTELCNYNYEYVPNNAFTQVDAPPLPLETLWIQLKQKIKNVKTKVTHTLRIVLNAPELFHHKHHFQSTLVDSVHEDANDDNTEIDGADKHRRWSVLDRIRRMSFIALNELEEKESSNKVNTKASQSHHELFESNMKGNCKSRVKPSEQLKLPEVSTQHNVPPEKVIQPDEEINTEYSSNAFHFVPSMYFIPSCYPFAITSDSHFHGRTTNQWVCVNKPSKESVRSREEENKNTSISSWHTTHEHSENASNKNDNDENPSKVLSSSSSSLFYWSSATLRINNSAQFHESTYTFPIERKTGWTSSSSNCTLTEAENENKDGNDVEHQTKAKITTKCFLYIKKTRKVISHYLHKAIRFCVKVKHRVWMGFTQRSEHIIELVKEWLFIPSKTRRYHYLGTHSVLTFADVYTWRRNAVRRLRELQHFNQNVTVSERQYTDKNEPHFNHRNNNSCKTKNWKISNEAKKQYERPYWYDNARKLVEEMYKSPNIHTNRKDYSIYTENNSTNKTKQKHEQEQLVDDNWDEYIEFSPHSLKMQAPRAPSLLPHGELSVLCETQTFVGKEHNKLMHFLLLNSGSPTEHFLHKESDCLTEHKLESELYFKEQTNKSETEEENENLEHVESVQIIDFDFNEHMVNNDSKRKSKEIEITKKENKQSKVDECVLAAQNMFIELRQWWDEHNYIFPVCNLQTEMERTNNIFSPPSSPASHPHEHHHNVKKYEKQKEELWANEYESKVNKFNDVQQWYSSNPLGVPQHSNREHKHYNYDNDNDNDNDAITHVTIINAEPNKPTDTKSTVSSLTERNVEEHIFDELNSDNDHFNDNQNKNNECEHSTLQNDSVNEPTSSVNSSWSSACSSFATSTGYYASGVNSYYTSDLMKCLVGVNNQNKQRLSSKDKHYKIREKKKKNKYLWEVNYEYNASDRALAVENEQIMLSNAHVNHKKENNYKNKSENTNGKVHHKYNGNPLTCELPSYSSSSYELTASVKAASTTASIIGNTVNSETRYDIPSASCTSSQHTSQRFVPPSRYKSHPVNVVNNSSRDSAVVNNRFNHKNKNDNDNYDNDDEEDVNLVELMRELHLRDSNTKYTEKTNSLTRGHSFRFSNSHRDVHNMKNELCSSKTSLNKTQPKLMIGKMDKDKNSLCAVDSILVNSPEDQSVKCNVIKSDTGSKTRKLSRVLHLHKLLSQSSLSEEELLSASTSSRSSSSSSSVFISSGSNTRSLKCASSLTSSLRFAVLQPNQEKEQYEKMLNEKNNLQSSTTSRLPEKVKIRKTASLYNLAKMKMHNFSNRWNAKMKSSEHADEEMCRQLCKSSDNTVERVTMDGIHSKENTDLALENKKTCFLEQKQLQASYHEQIPQVSSDVNVFDFYSANDYKENDTIEKELPEEYLELGQEYQKQHSINQEAKLSFRSGCKRKSREEESVLLSSSSSSSSSEMSSFLEKANEESTKARKGEKTISTQRLRYHYVLRVELLQSFWDNQAQLRSVQRAIDKKIYHTLQRIIQMYLFLLGSIAAIALALALSGILKKLDSGFFIDGQRYTWSTVSYELAHYPSWDDFTHHCCCVAVTNLSGTEPPFYAMDAENWICENGFTKQRIRRDRLDTYMGTEQYHNELEQEEEYDYNFEELLSGESLTETSTIQSVKSQLVHALHKDTSYVDGYAVRALCAMNFTHGCELVFSKHNHAEVVSIKCNDSSITSAELKR